MLYFVTGTAADCKNSLVLFWLWFRRIAKLSDQLDLISNFRVKVIQFPTWLSSTWYTKNITPKADEIEILGI